MIWDGMGARRVLRGSGETIKWRTRDMISLNQDGEPCHRGSTSRVEASSPRLRSRGKGQQGGGTVFFCGWWKGWLLVRMTRRRGNGGNGANAIYTLLSSDA